MTMKKKPESTFIANATKEIEKIFEKRYCTLRAAAGKGVEPLMDEVNAICDEANAKICGPDTPDSVMFEYIALWHMLGTISTLRVIIDGNAVYRFTSNVRQYAELTSDNACEFANRAFGNLKTVHLLIADIHCEDYIDTSVRNYWTEAGHDPMD